MPNGPNPKLKRFVEEAKAWSYLWGGCIWDNADATKSSNNAELLAAQARAAELEKRLELLEAKVGQQVP